MEKSGKRLSLHKGAIQCEYRALLLAGILISTSDKEGECLYQQWKDRGTNVYADSVSLSMGLNGASMYVDAEIDGNIMSSVYRQATSSGFKVFRNIEDLLDFILVRTRRNNFEEFIKRSSV